MALHTLRNIRSINAPGMHGDGGGLYLKVTKSGTKSWIYRFQLSGKRREMGLGDANVVALAKARQLAADCRETVAEGSVPKPKRNHARHQAHEISVEDGP